LACAASEKFWPIGPASCASTCEYSRCVAYSGEYSPSGASGAHRRREEHPLVSIVRLGLREARVLAGGTSRAVLTRSYRNGSES
jgi:hypothetical protein